MAQPIAEVSSSLPFPGISYAGPWTVRVRNWRGLSITSFTNCNGTCTVVKDANDGELLSWQWEPSICHRGFQRKGVAEMSREFLRKQASKAEAKQTDFEASCPKFEKSHPNLFGFMACNVGLEDGTVRERSKVSIFCEGGRFKAALHDPETGASIYTTLDTPSEALDGLEQALEEEKPDWRKWGKKSKRP